MSEKKILTGTFSVCGLAMVCSILWGSAFPCVKIGYELMGIPADGANQQILFAGMRFFLAGILTLIIGSVGMKRVLVPKRESWPMVVKLSAFQTVFQYLFFYLGLAHTSGVKASIIEGTNAFMAILIASLIFRQEKLTARKIAGCILGFGGVALANWQQGMDFAFQIEGEGFIFLATLGYAIASVLVKDYSKKEDPVVLSGWQFALGGLVMIVWAFAWGAEIPQINGGGIAMLLYLAMVSAVAFSLWSALLKYNPVSKITVFGLMYPVFGVILSGLLLDEGAQAFNGKTIAALILVSAGIWVVNWKQKSGGQDGLRSSRRPNR